jgi:SAM-dependent methyltransferase
MRLRRLPLTVLFVASFAAAQTTPKSATLPEVPYVPTENTVVDAMLKLAGVKSTDTVYDLGCGDGRIVVRAAKYFGAHGVGVDINPERIQDARENAKRNNVEVLVRFEEGDLFDADIHNATVVTLYLLPNVNLRLRPKLLADLKPGTRIVSHSFDMGDWKPEKQETIDGATIYLWTVPEKK